MSSGGMSRRVVTLRHMAVVAVVLGSSLGSARYAQQRGHADDQREDCPHDWKGHPNPADPTRTITHIAVAPVISEIPEFHDCQKFIATAGRSYVGQPMAIFAHQTLLGQWNTIYRMRVPNGSADGIGQGAGGTITVQPITGPDTLTGQVTGTAAGDAAVVAEILNYGDEYSALGIKKGFNCLFVTLTAPPQMRLRAAMVQVLNDSSCIPLARFDTLLSNAGGKELTIRPTATGSPLRNYPPVARWDWDAGHKKHYVGIMCGSGWCEVGDTGFGSSPTYTGDRVHTIKGWYDQQRLATTASDGESLIPSTVIGTVFPSPLLGSLAASAFSGNWVQVASVALSHESDEYKTKLNFDPSPPGEARNRIYLCHGTKRGDCAPKTVLGAPAVWRLPVCLTGETGETWWAKIHSATTGTDAYRCVDRWAASAEATDAGFKVPATARWRWLLKDETIWQACIQGCCQVKHF